MLGAKKVGVLAYGSSSSSVSAAKAFMNYAVPEVGLDPTYTNTSVDFGAQDVGPQVLGIKNAGVDGVYLPMAAATNIAVAAGAAAERGRHEGICSRRATARTSSTRPRRSRCLPVRSSVTAKPVEIKDAATKQFQADLKKYAKVTGVPDFGM